MSDLWRFASRPGFSIVELLVVISIIILLIAMLLPSLNNARDQARTMKCQTVVKQTAVANAGYADDLDGRYIYNTYGGASYKGVNYTDYWSTTPDFLDRVGLTTEEVSNKWKTNPGHYGAGFQAGCQWPDKFDCPSQGKPNYWVQNDYWGHEIGIAYNRETHGDSGRAATINNASEKFQFADGDNWWMSSRFSDYLQYFDRGHIDHGGWGGMIPRHHMGDRDAANIAFYDAHVELVAKEETYVYGGEAAGFIRQHWQVSY